MAFLIVEEQGKTRHVPLVGIKIVIGRAPDADIVISDEKSSRHHAVLEYEGDTYTLRDLKSLNGCFVDGMRVREHTLRFGDSFSIGATRLTLETETATAFETKAGSLETIGSVPEMPPRESTAVVPVPASLNIGVPGKTSAPEEASPGPATVSTEGLLRALRAFERVSGKPHIDRLLEAICEFCGRLLPQTRVCLALTKDGEVAPKAFFNFITRQPLDELPRDFSATATRVLSGMQPQFFPYGNGPARAYLPLQDVENEHALLFMEREQSDRNFHPPEQELMRALAAPASAIAGIKHTLREHGRLKQTIRKLEEELARMRSDLQRRSDLQTAELSRIRSELPQALIAEPQYKYSYEGIVGKSAKMREVFALLDKITDLAIPVLVVGESGTGKESICKALHYNSRRALSGKYMIENCAALPEPLLESELFGYKKGAFTGADKDKEGLFQFAHHGTIVLDEIGETTPALQAKLLRVLEEGEIRPIGSSDVRKVDFRLVAATNRDLEEMVKAGRFRQDLYYRLAVVTVRVPSLRERRDDIPLLVNHFLKLCAEEGKGQKFDVSSGVLRVFMGYAWPGNVRELENEVRRMVAIADGNKLNVEMVSPHIREGSEPILETTDDISLKQLVEHIEKRRIEEVLKRTQGNKSKAAELLGLSRLGLRKKMDRYGIKDE